MLERLNELDRDDVAQKLCDILWDDRVNINGSLERIAEAYDNGSDDFKKGIDKALMEITYMNMEELVKHMCKGD